MTTIRHADFWTDDHGSICLVCPITTRAEQWIAEHVSDEAQWMGPALVVEPRYMRDLVDGMESDGLVRA
jgi:hypothetical protein